MQQQNVTWPALYQVWSDSWFRWMLQNTGASNGHSTNKGDCSGFGRIVAKRNTLKRTSPSRFTLYKLLKQCVVPPLIRFWHIHLRISQIPCEATFYHLPNRTLPTPSTYPISSNPPNFQRNGLNPNFNEMTLKSSNWTSTPSSAYRLEFETFLDKPQPTRWCPWQYKIQKYPPGDYSEIDTLCSPFISLKKFAILIDQLILTLYTDFLHKYRSNIEMNPATFLEIRKNNPVNRDPILKHSLAQKDNHPSKLLPSSSPLRPTYSQPPFRNQGKRINFLTPKILSFYRIQTTESLSTHLFNHPNHLTSIPLIYFVTLNINRASIMTSKNKNSVGSDKIPSTGLKKCASRIPTFFFPQLLTTGYSTPISFRLEKYSYNSQL